MTELERLWQAHCERRFPERCRGEEICDVDLVLVDAAVAGCVQSFLSNGVLDEARLELLKRAGEELEEVLPQLHGEERSYFDSLRAFVVALVGS